MHIFNEEGRRLGSWIALGGVVVLAVLCVCAALPYFTRNIPRDARTSSAAEGQAQDQTPEDAMTAFRTEREQLRAMQKSQLEEMAADENISRELAEEAHRQALLLAQWAEKELTIEGVLKMRGYADAVCTVHEDSVNVLLRTPAISQQESATILELVMRETEIDAANVKIIPIN